MNIIMILAILILVCGLIGLSMIYMLLKKFKHYEGYCEYDESSIQMDNKTQTIKTEKDSTESLINLIGKPIYRVSDYGDRSYSDPTDMICIPVKKIEDKIIVKYSFSHFDLNALSLEILDSRFYDDCWKDATPFLQEALKIEKETGIRWQFNKLNNILKVLENEGIHFENIE